MKKSNIPQADYKEFEEKSIKTHGFLKWVLLVFLLAGGGIAALMFLPLSDYIALNQAETEWESVVHTLRKDMDALQELVRRQEPEKEQSLDTATSPVSQVVQQNIGSESTSTLNQEAIQQIKTDLKQKIFWSLLLNRLTRQVLEGIPYEAVLNQLEAVLPPGQVSLEALKVFAALGIPNQKAMLDQMDPQGEILYSSSQGIWGRFLDFLGRLVSVRKNTIENDQEVTRQALERANPFELPSILKFKFPRNESMIRMTEQRADALKNLDDLESFIINTLQES